MTQREEYLALTRLGGASFRKWQREWEKYYNAQIVKYFENINKSNPLDYIFDTEELQELFNRMYGDVGLTFARHSFQVTKAQAVIKPTDWLYEAIQFAIEYGGDKIISISKTGKDLVKQIIANATAEGIELGLSPWDLEKEIEKVVLDKWRFHGKFNAERIARTETLTASSYGSFIGARDTGLEIQKIWLTNMDGRERETHAQANGQTVGMDEYFIVGGSQMLTTHAAGAPPEEVINCRCVTQYRPIIRSPRTNEIIN